MKILLKLVLVFVTISTFLSCKKQERELHYISMYITPITRINCDKLKSSSHLKQLDLTIKEQNNLIDIFTRLKLAGNGWEVDARVFGSIEKDSKKYDFCAGIGVIEINNNIYIVDDKLRNYLLKLTNR